MYPSSTSWTEYVFIYLMFTFFGWLNWQIIYFIFNHVSVSIK